MSDELTTNYMALSSSEVKEHFPYQAPSQNASASVTLVEKKPEPIPHIGRVKLQCPSSEKKK